MANKTKSWNANEHLSMVNKQHNVVTTTHDVIPGCCLMAWATWLTRSATLTSSIHSPSIHQETQAVFGLGLQMLELKLGLVLSFNGEPSLDRRRGCGFQSRTVPSLETKASLVLQLVAERWRQFYFLLKRNRYQMFSVYFKKKANKRHSQVWFTAWYVATVQIDLEMVILGCSVSSRWITFVSI